MIRWLRNGQELTGNEPGVSILEDGTLLILASLSPLDNGEYVCAAANDAGSTERKYQLKVNGIDLFFLVLTDDFGIGLMTITALSPVIMFNISTVPPDFRDSETQRNVSLVLSQSTNLVCDVTGSPTPVITWYKDGTPVGETPLNKMFPVYNT